MNRSLREQVLRSARQSVLIMLLVASLFATMGGAAMATIRFTEVGRWGGACTAVAVSDDVAYVGMGSSLLIEDISNPASPERLGTLFLPTRSTVASIAVSGSYAYVLAFESGLCVVDVSDPGSPAIVGFCSTNVYAMKVAVSGNYAYVADWSGGLKIVDISDPTCPTEVGRYAVAGYSYAIAVSGNYAYLTDYSGLLAIDVTDPTHPTKAGVLAGVYAQSIVISGDRLYTASGFTNGFQVFDISSPASPVRIGVRDTPGEALGVTISGSYAYVGDSLSGLQIVDITNPATPTIVGTLDTIHSSRGVAVYGSHVLVADHWDGLLIVDVSDPGRPTQTSGIRSGNVHGAAVLGSTVYAACCEDDAGITYALNTLDAHNPADIVQIGSCAIPSSGYVGLSDDYAWVAGYAKGLHIVGVAAPANPAMLGTLDTPGTAKHVALFDHYACLADGNSGIQIMDAANPANPIMVGSYNTKGFAYAVAVLKGCAFVADGMGGLQVISLADPAAPTLVGSYPIPTDAYDIEISGHLAYVAAGNGGLQIFDIRKPSVPVRIGVAGYVPCSTLTLSGRQVYASGAVLDVSDPANPVLIGRTNIDGDIAVSGHRVYAVSGGVLRVMESVRSQQCIVYGFVTDPSGKPLRGITVSADPGGYAATTDYRGRYELDYVDPAAYTITASGPGWAPARITVAAANGQTVLAPDIVLLFGSVAGHIVDDLGNPVSNVTVNCGGSPSGTTDAEGNYLIGSLAPGSYRTTASKTGYVSVSTNVSVSGGQTTTCDFTLTRTGTITGCVKDNLGRPISGIGVWAYPYGGGTYPYNVGTDSSGAYVMSGLPPGTYDVAASDASWSVVIRSSMVIAAGATLALDFVLQLGTITGTVCDRIGHPIPGATVACSSYGLSATTDSGGVYTIGNVGPTYSSGDQGPVYYELTASKTGYISRTKTVHVRGGSATACYYALTAYGSISGTVTDSGGRPMSGASLIAQYSCYTYTATSDSTGHYRMPDMQPAVNINVTASKAGYTTVMRKIAVGDGHETVCDFRLADAVALDLVSSTSISNALPGYLQSN